MKRILAFALACLFVVLSALAELPEPEDMPTDMILGEARGVNRASVTLFYKSEDGAGLVPIRRTLEIPAGETAVERAMEELLHPGAGAEIISVAPGDTQVIGVESVSGIVTVNLSIDAAGLQSDQELLVLYTAICNTLMSIEGVRAVDVLIGSRQESIYSLPTGAMTARESDVTVLWAQYQSEEERFLEAGENPASLDRYAVLYFPSTNGQWILPELRGVRFRNEDYASQLLDELIAGAYSGDAYSSFLSGGVSVLASEPQLYASAAGERVLEIFLTGALRDYMILQGVSEWQMAAAITATMCTFIPELDAVIIYVDGQPITELNVRGNIRQYPGGLLRRDAFAAYIGGVAPVYFSDGAGGLTKVVRAMSARRSRSAYSLLLQLISGPTSVDVGAYAVMPAGVSADDVLGVAIADDVATVNFSANFYRLCQTLDSAQERALVFAVVNTLCELPDVRAVAMLIEGERVETLANDIYSKSELLPNAGMVR
ncbi:MAG: GerMN domain-containing protein [Christensenellales bacterium]